MNSLVTPSVYKKCWKKPTSMFSILSSFFLIFSFSFFLRRRKRAPMIYINFILQSVPAITPRRPAASLREACRINIHTKRVERGPQKVLHCPCGQPHPRGRRHTWRTLHSQGHSNMHSYYCMHPLFISHTISPLVHSSSFAHRTR